MNGVFATKDLAAHTVIGKYPGRHILECDLQRLEEDSPAAGQYAVVDATKPKKNGWRSFLLPPDTKTGLNNVNEPSMRYDSAGNLLSKKATENVRFVPDSARRGVYLVTTAPVAAGDELLTCRGARFHAVRVRNEYETTCVNEPEKHKRQFYIAGRKLHVTSKRRGGKTSESEWPLIE